MSDAGVGVVIGKPGSGKSYFAVRCIVMAVLRGEPVVTNVPLRDGWSDVVARMRLGRFHGRKWKLRRAAQLRALVHQVEDVRDLPRIGVPKCGRCETCRQGLGCVREGRALAVLDEAPKFLDARLWNLAPGGEEGGKPILLRKLTVDFFRMHRHRGFGVLLLTQAEQLLDAQVRGMGERYIVLRNLRRIPHWGNPFWYLRLDLFCATTYWGVPGKAGTLRAKTDWCLLNRRIARVYDTMGGFASDGSEEPDLWPWGGGPAPAAEVAGPENLQGPDTDDDVGSDDLQDHTDADSEPPDNEDLDDGSEVVACAG